MSHKIQMTWLRGQQAQSYALWYLPGRAIAINRHAPLPLRLPLPNIPLAPDAFALPPGTYSRGSP